LPPVLESLTGIKFEKLMEQVPALKKAMSKDDDKKK
jgi:flotillin